MWLFTNLPLPCYTNFYCFQAAKKIKTSSENRRDQFGADDTTEHYRWILRVRERGFIVYWQNVIKRNGIQSECLSLRGVKVLWKRRQTLFRRQELPKKSVYDKQ